jgi:PAS domain S-box-containing protein
LNLPIPRWNNIIKIGYTSGLDYGKLARLATLNALCAISIGLVIAFVLFFISIGSFSALEALLILPVLVFVLYLNSKYHYSYARFIFIFTLLLLILLLALSDRRAGTEYIIIAVGCLSALVFESIVSILMAMASAVAFYLFYVWFDATYPFISDPTIPYSFVRFTSVFISILIVIIQLLVFRFLTNKYAIKLEEANRNIQTINEELQATNEELRSQTDQLDFLVQQKSAELQAYIDAININIYSAITNLAGTILKVNKPLMDISGYSEQELIGKNFRMLNAGIHSAFFFKNLMETIHAGKNWRGEIKNKAKDGSYFWIEMVIMPIKTANKVTSHFLTLALPITERKESEDKLLASARLLESIAFRTSHNVRAPITRMQGLMHLISKNYIQQNELAEVAEHLRFSIQEVDTATSELTQFVNDQYRDITPS